MKCSAFICSAGRRWRSSKRISKKRSRRTPKVIACRSQWLRSLLRGGRWRRPLRIDLRSMKPMRLSKILANHRRVRRGHASCRTVLGQDPIWRARQDSRLPCQPTSLSAPWPYPSSGISPAVGNGFADDVPAYLFKQLPKLLEAQLPAILQLPHDDTGMDTSRLGKLNDLLLIVVRPVSSDGGVQLRFGHETLCRA